jgi:TPR repeat protein
MSFLLEITPTHYEDKPSLLFLSSSNQGFILSTYQLSKYLINQKDIADWNIKLEKISFLYGNHLSVASFENSRSLVKPTSFENSSTGTPITILELMTLSANQNYPLAQLDLAEYYDDLNDDEKQLYYLQLVSKQSHIPGIYALAIYYKIHEDYQQYISHLTILASDYQDSNAQYELGLLY